ncbi:hypothetical protein PCK1_002236 [Pneumocystis canis]|nr:hypothetical protein PCK1_002236 [Pneumocystis canis]
MTIVEKDYFELKEKVQKIKELCNKLESLKMRLPKTITTTLMTTTTTIKTIKTDEMSNTLCEAETATLSENMICTSFRTTNK